VWAAAIQARIGPSTGEDNVKKMGDSERVLLVDFYSTLENNPWTPGEKPAYWAQASDKETGGAWGIGIEAAAGLVYTYSRAKYMCLRTHETTKDLTPDKTEKLFKRL